MDRECKGCRRIDLIRSRAPSIFIALKAAMAYIDECPCDPDIYPEQLEAWNRLKSLDAKALIKELDKHNDPT